MDRLDWSRSGILWTAFFRSSPTHLELWFGRIWRWKCLNCVWNFFKRTSTIQHARISVCTEFHRLSAYINAFSQVPICGNGMLRLWGITIFFQTEIFDKISKYYWKKFLYQNSTAQLLKAAFGSFWRALSNETVFKLLHCADLINMTYTHGHALWKWYMASAKKY